MPETPLPKRRNSLRYPGYDYSQPGCIFVTLCIHDRQHLFGEVVDGEMIRSPQGDAAAEHLNRIEARFPGTVVDTLIVMPDHLHAIVIFGTDPDVPLDSTTNLSAIVKWYKVSVQARYRAEVAAERWPRYRVHLWQRDYHDRIIRTDAELDATRLYIEDNPRRWQEKHDERTAGTA